MANKYEGTQTEKNLETAFAGESQARNKYTYFASVAKKRDLSRFQPCSRKLPTTRRACKLCSRNSVASVTPQLT